MKTKTIVFPTDFSTLSDAALGYATSFARDTGGKLLIVHIEEPPAAYGGGEMYYGLPDPDTAALTAMLHRVVPPDPQVAYEHKLLLGDPAGEIVALAESVDADLIVLASHGRTGLRRLLMGSVAEAVVRRATCPVLTFKPHPEPAAK